MKTRFGLILTFLITALLISVAGWSEYKQPQQPNSGPGGSDYIYPRVVKGEDYWVDEMNDETRYRIYEPAMWLRKADEAPVVLFLHGWCATKEETYESWIKHIVKKGYVVVWVQYQICTLPLPGNYYTDEYLFAPNARMAWEDALNRLSSEAGHVKPKVDGNGRLLTAFIGHSVGGLVAAKMAADYAQNPYSRTLDRDIDPYALVLVEPSAREKIKVEWEEDYKLIREDTKLLIIASEHDEVNCIKIAQRIWDETEIDPSNKDFLMVHTDRRGKPEIIADHLFPETFNNQHETDLSVDARDFFITYKLSVATLNCTFRSDSDYCETFTGGSPEQLYMGLWKGTEVGEPDIPVIPMEWVTDPSTITNSAPCK